MPKLIRMNFFPAMIRESAVKLCWPILLIGILSVAVASAAEPTVDQVLEQLKTGSSAQRRAAAQSLGKLGDRRAIEALTACLHDKDRSVARAAVASLVKIGQPAVDPLIACLADRNSAIRSAAVQGLGQLGDKRAVGPLIACLRDEESYIRSEAITALAKLGDAQAVDPLIACLKEPRTNVRRAAAEALAKLGDKRAVDPLIACLDGEEPMVRRAAADALGKLGDKRAVQALAARLNDDEPMVRGTAAQSLGKLGDKAAAPRLVAALPDWPINSALANALKEFQWEPATDRERLYWRIGTRDRDSLALDWEPSKRLLLEDARSRNPKRIENAINTFIAVGKHDMVPELVKILDATEDTSICEIYLNCGHPVLGNAGRRWATKRGYTVTPGSSNSGPNWGSW